MMILLTILTPELDFFEVLLPIDFRLLALFGAVTDSTNAVRDPVPKGPDYGPDSARDNHAYGT